jgi:hypothetical protein
MRGLEPPPGCPDTDLNRARLPIPPHPLAGRHFVSWLTARPVTRQVYPAVPIARSARRRHGFGLCPTDNRAPVAARYCERVGELLEAVANVAAYAAVIVLVGWALQRVFGVQVFGIGGLVGVLVVLAGARVFSNSGLRGLIATVVCLLAVAIVIGMAMTFGDRPDRIKDERPPEEF